MSRVLIGHERTQARKVVAALAGADPAEVARLLSMRVTRSPRSYPVKCAPAGASPKAWSALTA